VHRPVRVAHGRDRCFDLGHRAVRGCGDVERRSGEPSERVGFVPRVLFHTGNNFRVRRLYEQRTYSTHERGRIADHFPRHRVGAK